MAYEYLNEFAAGQRGTEVVWQAEWGAWKYLLGGKMYAMRGEHKDGRPILTVKLPPERGDFLRQQYEDIIPGYYMNKLHWNSIYLDGALGEEDVLPLLREAYATGLSALSAKARKELVEG